MTEVIRFGKMYQEDMARGSSADTVRLADGTLATMTPLLDADGRISPAVGGTGVVSITEFGALPTASAATNTTAANDAIATGLPVFVPPGTFGMNALDEVTAPLRLFGVGRSSILRFNTTADCIHLHPAASSQAETYDIHHLAFENATNVPASFIRNENALNVRLDHLYFSNCAATYCIDNENGYGLKVADSTFGTITGSGVRLRDDGASAEYSYVACIEGCDFTILSGDGLVVEGAQGLRISDTVIESCSGKGIDAATAGGTVQAWNMVLENVYFEANTGTDIDLQSAADRRCVATLIGCNFIGTPVIALGTGSQVLILGTACGGGSNCTITGTGWATATLIGSFNFVQSGTFPWIELGPNLSNDNTTVPTTYTPTWSASGTQPTIGDGTLTGTYTKLGQRVEVHIVLTIGSTTTLGTGAWYLTLPFDALYANEFGMLVMDDTGVAVWSGHARTYAANDVLTLATTSGETGSGQVVGAAVPFAWSTGDILTISISYWV